jgi:hypothetical protein
MSETYSKLFASITDSTIWAEPNTTRIVWITMLAMSDRFGYVGASIPGLANRARVTIEECEAAINSFLSPDPYSRSQENEGRRIEVADRGWILLNYERFRDMRDEEARKEYERNRKREQRAKSTQKMSRNVPRVPKCPAVSAHTEAEAYTDNGSTNVDPTVWLEFVSHRKSIRKPLSKLSADKNFKILEALTVEQQRACVDATIANNWTGLFPPKVSHGNHQGNTPTSAGDRVRAATAKREADARASGADY